MNHLDKVSSLKYWHSEYNISPIRDNEVYVVTDITTLNNLNISQTLLNPGYCTSGHSHENSEEVYIFMNGSGTIQVGDRRIKVYPGDTVPIPAGAFHKVFNDGDTILQFTAIFQRYDGR